MIYLLYAAVIAAVILFDQVSKLLAAAKLQGGAFEVIKGVLRFSYVENEGMAFGLLADRRWIFLLLSTVGLSLLAFYLFRYVKNKRMGVALALILGGGVGNMIDRLRLGYVIDFIDFCAFPKLWVWVFNIADSAVCVGGALFVLFYLSETVKEEKAKKKQKEGEEHEDSAGNG